MKGPFHWQKNAICEKHFWKTVVFQRRDSMKWQHGLFEDTYC
jgi:hypothetical protein